MRVNHDEVEGELEDHRRGYGTDEGAAEPGLIAQRAAHVPDPAEQGDHARGGNREDR
jgi:hypothetical protein